MRDLKLYVYVDGVKTLLDLFKDESVVLNQSIQDIRDVGSVFTDYSQGFTIPASDNNNSIFRHFYNFNVYDGFDARIKIDADIEISGITFSTGKLKLESVQLKDSVAYAYRVTFFGSTITLKDLLGEDELDQLDMSAFDQTYDENSIKLALRTGILKSGDSKALISPLIVCDTADGDDIYNGQVPYTYLKYAIRVRHIIDAIESKYGITFSSDFFSTLVPEFNDLYLFLHREAGAMKLPSGTFLSNWQNLVTTYNTIYFSASAGGFSIADIGTSVGTKDYDIVTNLDVDVTDEFTVYLYYNGSPIQSRTVSGSTSYVIDWDYVTNNGFYTIKVQHTTQISVATSSYWTFIRRYLDGSIPNDTFTVQQDPFVIGSVFTFVVADNMPKMKVIDFLTGIFKMFNLTAYVENDIIVVKTLDDFYASGSRRDWTEYVDMSEADVNPLSIYKQMNFSYKGLSNLLANQHDEFFNNEWGTEQYEIGSKYDGTEYTVESPFEHLKYERIILSNGTVTDLQAGYMLDNKAEKYLGDPLLFYSHIVEADVTLLDATPINQYHAPTNSRALDINEQSLNFSAEFDEWHNSPNTNTLFSTYYSTYIASIFNVRGRIIKQNIILPVGELITYNLNDTIVINGNEFYINSISTNLNTGKGSVELKTHLR